MREHEHEWLSVHLAVPPVESVDGGIMGRAGDLALHDVVAPLVRRLRADGRMSRAFFIRYFVGGPHIRLRLRAAPDEHAALFAEVESACARFIGLEPIRAHYEPEYARYGGESGVEASERLFEASSDLVLSLLPTLVRGDSAQDLRFGHGVLGLVLFAGAYLANERLDEVASFLDRYSGRRNGRPEDRAELDRQYRMAASMRGLFRAAANPELLPEGLARAAQGFHESRRALETAWERAPVVIQGETTPSTRFAMRRLTSSYVHMHLNRQGVPTRHEALVAGVAASVLRAEVVAA